jgi:hypothetical protein
MARQRPDRLEIAIRALDELGRLLASRMSQGEAQLVVDIQGLLRAQRLPCAMCGHGQVLVCPSCGEGCEQISPLAGEEGKDSAAAARSSPLVGEVPAQRGMGGGAIPGPGSADRVHFPPTPAIHGRTSPTRGEERAAAAESLPFSPTRGEERRGAVAAAEPPPAESQP